MQPVGTISKNLIAFSSIVANVAISINIMNISPEE
jgi:hypothetical protein